MTTLQIMSLLFIHWIADFVCQSDQMAKKKSTHNGWLAVHVLAYGTALMLLVFIMAAVLIGPGHHEDIIGYAMINMLLHAVVDYFTSRLNAYYWRAEQRHNFFVSIGFDQVLHYACLFTTFNWIL